MPTISPSDFSRAVSFVKKADCRPFATLDATARMLGVRKFDIMDFLEKNPKLVVTSEHADYKKVRKPCYNPYTGKKTGYTTEQRISKHYGLCIDEAFASIEENPFNPEWLVLQKERRAKTLWLSEWNNYGEIQGHLIYEDARPSSLRENELFKDNRKNTWLWRNTRDKIEAARQLGALQQATFYFGGFGDCSSRPTDNAITREGVLLLEQAGWTLVGKWF